MNHHHWTAKLKICRKPLLKKMFRRNSNALEYLTWKIFWTGKSIVCKWWKVSLGILIDNSSLLFPWYRLQSRIMLITSTDMVICFKFLLPVNLSANESLPHNKTIDFLFLFFCSQQSRCSFVLRIKFAFLYRKILASEILSDSGINIVPYQRTLTHKLRHDTRNQ